MQTALLLLIAASQSQYDRDAEAALALAVASVRKEAVTISAPPVSVSELQPAFATFQYLPANCNLRT